MSDYYPSPAAIAKEFSLANRSVMFLHAAEAASAAGAQTIGRGYLDAVITIAFQQSIPDDEPLVELVSAKEWIECVPNRCGGRPVIKGTRLEVAFVQSVLAEGESIDFLVEGWPDVPRAAFEWIADNLGPGESS